MDLRTPYAVVTAVEQPRPATKRELVGISRRLEAAAMAHPPPLVAASLQDCRFLTARTREVYRRLAAKGASVTLLARGLHGWLDDGVRGVELSDDDPLVDEWVVVVPALDRPAVLVATDLRSPSLDELDREFLHAVSHDPEVVDACAALLARPAVSRHR